MRRAPRSSAKVRDGSGLAEKPLDAAKLRGRPRISGCGVVHFRHVLETVGNAGMGAPAIRRRNGDDDLVRVRRIGDLEICGEEMERLPFSLLCIIGSESSAPGALRVLANSR